MDEAKVAEYWDKNADAWTKLSRAGYNISRELLNTPALLALLRPETRVGQRGLDVGCGDGDLTRKLAAIGLRMTGLDLSPTFISHARDLETQSPRGIDYVVGSATRLPFADATFDAVTAMMSLMDMPRPDLAIAEAFRVLRPGGAFVFGITHPCFQTARWEWVKDGSGKRVGVVCGDYFDPPAGRIDVWTFGQAPAEEKKRYEKFRIPRFDFTLSWWINTLLSAGFVLERVSEPAPSDEQLRAHPELADNRAIAYFLHFSLRKP